MRTKGDTPARPQPGTRQRSTVPRQPSAPPPAGLRLLGENGRWILLMALLGLWAFLVLGRWSGRQPPAASVTASPSARAPEMPAGSPPRLSRLKLELLDLPREPYTPETKSIFRLPPPPPAPPPVRPVEIVRPAVPPPPDPFQEAAKQLRLVGFMQAGETPTALITQGTDLHMVTVGETLAGRFRVQSVTEESVLLSSPDGDKQVRLVLKEGTPPGAPGPGR